MQFTRIVIIVYFFNICLSANNWMRRYTPHSDRKYHLSRHIPRRITVNPPTTISNSTQTFTTEKTVVIRDTTNITSTFNKETTVSTIADTRQGSSTQTGSRLSFTTEKTITVRDTSSPKVFSTTQDLYSNLDTIVPEPSFITKSKSSSLTTKKRDIHFRKIKSATTSAIPNVGSFMSDFQNKNEQKETSLSTNLWTENPLQLSNQMYNNDISSLKGISVNNKCTMVIVVTEIRFFRCATTT